MENKTENQGKNKTAKGTLYLLFSQLTILISGYLIHIYLARKFGPAIYGVFGILLSLFAINKVIFLSGSLGAVSKYVSAVKEKANFILKAGMELQLILIGICLLFYYFFSDKVALIFHDPSLTSLIQFSAWIIFPVGIYIILVRGYLNGMKMFKHQTLLEALHSLLKLIFALIFVYFGFEIFGALTAYILAPLIVFLISLKFIKRENGWKNLRTKEKFSKLKLIKFGLPTTLFYVFTTFFLELGLLTIKAVLQNDVLAGFYTSANSLARIPYSLFMALPVIMLPSISSALANQNIKLVRKYIQQSLRYALMILSPITVLVSVYANNIIQMFYSSIFLPAGEVLKILIFGLTFFSLFMILCSFMFGANKPGVATYIALTVSVIAFFLNVKLVKLFGLNGAAWATVGTAFLGLVISSIYVYIKFKTLFNRFSAIKIIVASIIIYVLATLFPVSGKLFILYIILFLLLYLFILRLFKELKDEDIQMFLNVFKLNRLIKGK